MDDGTNIWSKSIWVIRQNSELFLAYCAVLPAIGILQEFLKQTSGNNFALVFTSVILAIPAHLSVLSNIRAFDAMRELQRKNPKYMIGFFFRTIALGVISVVPTFLLVVILSGIGWGKNVVVSTTILALVLLSAIVFAKWGTMLPAVLMQNDKTFSKAGRRGNISFSYAFPRLILSFGLLTIVQLVVALIAAIVLGAGGDYFPATGGFDFALLCTALLAAIIGGYQVIMTSVILSRAYLRAENIGANQNDPVPIETM
ncbi:hypothetical protein [Mesorhizobium sp. DCY119]|uniref:hypothetical protein n=1 Tax=Mesorhizobium sp. DCY119 TaxID=2108445 RepID=UPI000E6BA06D|nr:hypothetical protein [Mesorhizobium sp. DCY119]RJG43912.1 hypothetical protein D3Y55_06335 [Mesorhizobium sp. DCY119]